jgi:branched-chain amino acid transport system substrate-binding protein
MLNKINQKTKLQCLTSLMSILLLAGCQDMARDEFAIPADSALLGLLGPLSGADSTLGTSVERGALLAIKEINESGGVLGRQLALIRGDDQCTASNGAMTAKRLIEKGVLAVVGGACSGPAIHAIENYLNPNNIMVPFVGTTSTSPYLTGLYMPSGSTSYFRTQPSDAKQGAVLANYIKNTAGKSTVSIIAVTQNGDGSENYYGNRFRQSFVSAYQTAGGTIINTIEYKKGTTDFTAAQINTLYASNPQGIVLISYPLEAAGISKAIGTNKPGSTTPLFGGDASYTRTILDNGNVSVLEGITGTSPAADFTSANYIAFANAYKNRTGRTAPENAENGYDAVYSIAYAAIKGNALTSEAIKSNLISVTGGATGTGTVINVGEFAKGVQTLSQNTAINYEGASGSLNFDSNGDPSVGYYIIWKVVNGQIVTIGTAAQ